MRRLPAALYGADFLATLLIALDRRSPSPSLKLEGVMELDHPRYPRLLHWNSSLEPSKDGSRHAGQEWRAASGRLSSKSPARITFSMPSKRDEPHVDSSLISSCTSASKPAGNIGRRRGWPSSSCSSCLSIVRWGLVLDGLAASIARVVGHFASPRARRFTTRSHRRRRATIFHKAVHRPVLLRHAALSAPVA